MARAPKIARSIPNKARRIEGIVTSVGGLLGPRLALVIFLRPWREVGGSVQRTELRVEVPVESEAAIKRGMVAWDDKTVSLAVERLRDASANRLEWNVARSRLRETKASPELLDVKEEQAKPRSVRSRVFGTLELDRRLGWYEGKRRAAGAAYAVHVDVADPDDDRAVSESIARAEPLVLQVQEARPRLREAIAAELLRIYNENWREDDQHVVSAIAFKRNLTLKSVHVGRSRITAYFDAAGMFTDHVVEVRLSSQLEVEEICIAG